MFHFFTPIRSKIKKKTLKVEENNIFDGGEENWEVWNSKKIYGY